MVRVAMTEARMLHRSIGWFAIVSSVVYLGLLLLQRVDLPGFDLVVPGLRAWALVLAIGLPMVWTVGRHPVRHLAAPLRAHAAWSLGIVAYGAALVACLTLVAFTLESKLATMPALAGFGLVALPVASFAPAIATLGKGTPGTVLAWSALWIASSGVLGLGWPIPLDRLAGLTGVPSMVSVGSSALTSLAGVLVSTALASKN